MSVDPQLRTLEIEIPTQPEVLVKLSLLMAAEDIDLLAMSALVETDMALAAAVLKAVNSSLYGLRGKVQTVHQALTYLGMREVSGITFEMGLRAAFPPAAELDPVWRRASERGVMMGRMGQMLGVDPWAAHSAGLFEECGKAVLYRHAPAHYPAMLRAATRDVELVELERRAFGVTHDALGAALCESWGLAPAAVASVRHHVEVQDSLVMPDALQRRGVSAISTVAWALLMEPAKLEQVAHEISPQASLDETLVLRAARRVSEQLQQAQEHGR
ncbi:MULTISPECIES: HDOD domain-containing protein [unclassified Roseateles]|uniref:HDOD domain-containing protein n=1 Tax=unclassified Roseateles TaxID=2626991 RepID=UPI000733A214|nr:HDOD domain-containing protein [Paucibacter sp. KCTC 42545]ALT78741.1 histidine kinase [Paucibacter sp. KCTC 42545]MBY0236131.1 HDOD domain-containing protein [Burkholderiaceae bacterium]